MTKTTFPSGLSSGWQLLSHPPLTCLLGKYRILRRDTRQEQTVCLPGRGDRPQERVCAAVRLEGRPHHIILGEIAGIVMPPRGA